MTVAYRASGTFVEANSTTTGAVGLPAGLTNGDVLVLLVQSRGTGNTVATPSGYTLAVTNAQTASHRFRGYPCPAVRLLRVRLDNPSRRRCRHRPLHRPRHRHRPVHLPGFAGGDGDLVLLDRR
jgi:hypothetical protein